jgi:hypothetical protein
MDGQLLLASGHLVVLSETAIWRSSAPLPIARGGCKLFRAGQKDVDHAALAGGILIVRNLAEMAAFDLRPR